MMLNLVTNCTQNHMTYCSWTYKCSLNWAVHLRFIMSIKHKHQIPQGNNNHQHFSNKFHCSLALSLLRAFSLLHSAVSLSAALSLVLSFSLSISWSLPLLRVLSLICTLFLSLSPTFFLSFSFSIPPSSLSGEEQWPMKRRVGYLSDRSQLTCMPDWLLKENNRNEQHKWCKVAATRSAQQEILARHYTQISDLYGLIAIRPG